MDYIKNKYSMIKNIITLPIVWSLLIPFMIVDLIGEIYHRICFPLYNAPYIKRSKYIKIDRHKLKYLNLFQKVSCAYCGYANGLLAYWVEIAARTEKYWCGIMHKKTKGFIPQKHHKKFKFTKYGSEKEFKNRYKK